jgi:pimeloyl-ACP methyl ester carboxylesterase
MSLPALHFVHGNSFPTGTYNTMLDLLRQHYTVQALPMHAHNPDYPVTDGWRDLRRELIDALEARHTEPVILVGHSMGGMLGLMAAAVRPDLVRCVVLLDSPVVAGWRALLLRFAKRRGLDDKFSPARFSAKRRQYWPDAEAAYQHFASKPMFAIWPQQVLRDYIEYGLVPHPEGVTLRFDREVETAVYRTLPHNVGYIVRHPFPVPVGFVGGTTSVECRQAGTAATRKLVGHHFRLIEGGHLYPMERPEAAAEATHAMIQVLLAEKVSQ